MSSTTYQARETGIHTIHIRGVAASKSHQRGSLIIFTTPTFNGRNVTIQGRGDCSDVRVYTSVVQHRHNGKTLYAASSPRLVPGNYYADGGGSRIFEEFTIDANYVSQMEWAY